MRSDSTLMSSLKNKILSKSEQDIKLDDHVAVAIDDDDELWFTQTHFAEIQELLRLIDEVKNRKTTVTKQLSADNEGENLAFLYILNSSEKTYREKMDLLVR